MPPSNQSLGHLCLGCISFVSLGAVHKEQKHITWSRHITVLQAAVCDNVPGHMCICRLSGPMTYIVWGFRPCWQCNHLKYAAQLNKEVRLTLPACFLVTWLCGFMASDWSAWWGIPRRLITDRQKTESLWIRAWAGWRYFQEPSNSGVGLEHAVSIAWTDSAS